MQSPVEYALKKVIAKIPPKVLNVAFPVHVGNVHVSVTEQVRTKVINAIVLPDINLGSGKSKNIVLQKKFHEATVYGPDEKFTNVGMYSLYRIPPEEREGLMISSVSALRAPYQYYNNVPEHYMGINPRVNASVLAQAVIDTHSMQGVIMLPVPELLAGDLIRLNPAQHNHLDYVVQCKLEYNENMFNLNPDAIQALGKLVVAATKAYIYNMCITDIDRVKMAYGTEQGTIQQIIDSYNDQAERYEELLEEFRGAATFDTKTLRNILQYMLPGL